MFKLFQLAPRLGTLASRCESYPIKFLRPFSVSPANRLKEIREVNDGKNITIEGVYVDLPKADKVLKVVAENPNSCSICSLGLEVKHTDVLILSQFVRPDGCMLPRRITGLCRKQQKRIGTMVTMAQRAGLMSNLNPTYSKKDPEKRGQWKKFKSYYDESTIGQRKPPKPEYKWIWKKRNFYEKV
ncbi:large ribosomal subunit protein mL66 [Neocloeon triangulifer]|uniref:large ribosomal subunit protein mL66 n=1 Tax=Neocloeon triangulifer TaxID=2078957 RepID=UPI00286EB8F6|nr:large ribosomal subunit protein mL66 [Neocloeon triangulifer]